MVIDRKDVRSWDPTNAWEKIGTHPDTYVPHGIKKGAPIDEAHGKWVVDPQDHSRFYIPNLCSDPYQHQYLEEQAKVATNDTPRAALPLVILLDIVCGTMGNLGH